MQKRLSRSHHGDVWDNCPLDSSFEISSSLKGLDLTFIGLRLVGVLVLTLGAFKYIEAKRSPVRAGKLQFHLTIPTHYELVLLQ